jgi:phosphate transport system substrate-binding protein
MREVPAVVLVKALHLASWRGAVLAGLVLAVSPATSSAQEQSIKISGNGASLATMQVLAQAYASVQPGASINVLPSVGSSGGIKAMLAGALQIAVSARELTAAEVQAGAVATECGRTPFVFATASTHPVNAVKTQDLVDFYAGRTLSWPDGSKLRLVLRPSTDSDTATVKAMSPEMREAASMAEQRKGMVFAVTDQEAASNIEKVPGALGTSTLALILSEHRAIKPLALDGVMPSPQTLASGAYPLHRSIYLVTGPKTSMQALAFVAFIRSPAGAEILQRMGHWVK